LQFNNQYKTGDLRSLGGVFENSRGATVIFWTFKTLEYKGNVFLRNNGKKFPVMRSNTQKNRFLSFQSVEILANFLGYNSEFKILENLKKKQGKFWNCECAFPRYTQTTQ
jgi:hypothetical protein